MDNSGHSISQQILEGLNPPARQHLRLVHDAEDGEKRLTFHERLVRARICTQDSDLPKSRIRILLFLIGLTKQSGGLAIDPGEERLAYVAGVSVSTVRRSLKDFRDCGILELFDPGQARHFRTQYLVQLDAIFALPQHPRKQLERKKRNRHEKAWGDIETDWRDGYAGSRHYKFREQYRHVARYPKNLTPKQALVLKKLVDLWIYNGFEAFHSPPKADIAKQVKVSARTVEYALSRFIRDGVLVITRVGGGQAKTHTYTISGPALFGAYG